MKFLGDALTFDDVLLVPGPSEVLPNEVDTQTYLTNKFYVHHYLSVQKVNFSFSISTSLLFWDRLRM